ncbi:MAG TPA: hypothetical protein PKV59_08985, partial [Flexilinea sp.]|nr:hypothetical protein [Flexilinea sp.]
RDKLRAAAPFSFVHFFWAKQKKWTNGFKRCGAPFDLSLNLGERMISKAKPLTTSSVTRQIGFKRCLHLLLSADKRP